jgi:DNA-binding LytR/AlgR family response regulator
MHATALIAEDEPLLAANLQAELSRLWPQLRIVASVGDGASALKKKKGVWRCSPMWCSSISACLG